MPQKPAYSTQIFNEAVRLHQGGCSTKPHYVTCWCSRHIRKAVKRYTYWGFFDLGKAVMRRG
jgi:hypothetical protein